MGLQKAIKLQTLFQPFIKNPQNGALKTYKSLERSQKNGLGFLSASFLL